MGGRAKLLAAAAVALAGGVVVRLRYGHTADTVPAMRYGTRTDAAEGDVLDQRPTPTTPAADARSSDPGVPEGDALEQAQGVAGEVLAHDLPADDDVPFADALEQATVVEEDR